MAREGETFLEVDQHLLENNCLKLKRKTRGIFGRMGDRDLEMEKMRMKMANEKIN